MATSQIRNANLGYNSFQRGGCTQPKEELDVQWSGTNLGDEQLELVSEKRMQKAEGGAC